MTSLTRFFDFNSSKRDFVNSSSLANSFAILLVKMASGESVNK